jgi:cell division protein FtsN
MARQRIDTTGYEVALNQNKTHSNNNTQNVKYASNNNNNDYTTNRVAKIEPAAMQTKAHYAIPPATKPQYEPITKMDLAAPAPKPGISAASSTSHQSLQVAGLTPPQTMAPAPILKPSNFYVQAGAFKEEKNALNFSKVLSAYGDSKVYLSRANNAPTFRVKLGPYASSEEATTALTSLRASGKNGIVIAE